MQTENEKTNQATDETFIRLEEGTVTTETNTNCEQYIIKTDFYCIFLVTTLSASVIVIIVILYMMSTGVSHYQPPSSISTIPSNCNITSPNTSCILHF